jgi:hypothetical protein
MVGTAQERLCPPYAAGSRAGVPRSGLLSIQIIDALGLGDIGKCAPQVAQAMEDNAAIDVGI